MKQQYTEENFLARWIANDLSPEELEQFQNSEDYHRFKKINDASQLLKTPEFNQEKVFSNIQERTLKNNKGKVFRLSPTWIYSAAASIILILTTFFFLKNNTSEFETSFGEQKTIVLPDNSKVHLASNSKLEFKKNNWKENRQLNLVGEAYFEVEKGKTFTVNTSEGNVVVLGTKFTVNTSNNFFEVQCFEGKVKATSKNKSSSILTKGKAFRVFKNNDENWDFSQETPTWIEGESTFVNTPISQVIIALEKQYNLKFDTTKIDVNKRFTGTFTHTNVNIALKTVFAPMKISYKLAKNSSVILTYN